MAKRVLVVDDEPDIVMMVESRLVANGYEVQTATGGREALEKCKTFRPDIIVLDVMMPEVDGPAVAQELRGHPETAKTKVIFLTAIVTEQEVSKTHNIGGNLFLPKPFKPEELLKMIELALKKS
jgi:DNA-binding response OmpR family regulator